jgi:hypothetical protein
MEAFDCTSTGDSTGSAMEIVRKAVASAAGTDDAVHVSEEDPLSP